MYLGHDIFEVNKMFLATTLECWGTDSLPKAWRFHRTRTDTWFCYCTQMLCFLIISMRLPALTENGFFHFSVF